MNSLDEKFTIRKAKIGDMLQVHKLIKELAEFEKLEDQVKIDASVLEEDGFKTSNPTFQCLVAEVPNSCVIGYALYYTCYSTWVGKSIFLEDLYVQPEHRKMGVGKQLILSVAKIAHELKGRLDFHVLSWNPAAEFYKSLGAVDLTNTEKWQLFRLDSSALNKLFS